MSEEKKPLDLLLDVMVFGPIGFAADARRLVPELAAKGRETLDVQVRLARMIGQFAVQKGQQEATKLLGRLWPSTQPAPPTAAAPSSNGAKPTPREEVIPVRVERAPVPHGDLAIADYDSLAASQVLPLLDNLSPSELEAVRMHESAHRKRKTILGRIGQLQTR